MGEPSDEVRRLQQRWSQQKAHVLPVANVHSTLQALHIWFQEDYEPNLASSNLALRHIWCLLFQVATQFGGRIAQTTNKIGRSEFLLCGVTNVASLF